MAVLLSTDTTSRMQVLTARFLLAVVIIGIFFDSVRSATKAKATQKKLSDPNDNKGRRK